MLLGNLLNSERIELQDQTSAIYTDDELIRASEKTISLMTRLLPKRDILEITITAPMFTSTNYNMFDLSISLSDYVKIEQIEFPVDQDPVTKPTFDIVGNYIIFRQKQTFTVGDKMRVTYLKKWTPPTPDADGNFPSHLNDPVIIGSAGQALIFKAEKYTQSARTAADLIISTLAGVTAITLSAPSLVIPSAPTLDVLTPPTAYTFVAPSAPSITAVTAVPSVPAPSFTDVATALGLIDTWVGYGKTALETGDDFINAATRGSEVGATWGKYADSYINGAVLFANKAQSLIKELETTLSKYQLDVAAYGHYISGYAANLNNAVAKYQQEIVAQVAASSAIDSATNIYKARIDENTQKLNKYASEVQAYQAQVNKYQMDIQAYVAQINKLTSYAQLLAPTVTNYLDIAGRYLASGQAKINEFAAMLGVKLEFYTQRSASEQR